MGNPRWDKRIEEKTLKEDSQKPTFARKRTIWISATLLAFGFLVVLIYLSARATEPRHSGRPMSYWVRRATYKKVSLNYHDDDRERAKAFSALTAIGAPASLTTPKRVKQRGTSMVG